MSTGWDGMGWDGILCLLHVFGCMETPRTRGTLKRTLQLKEEESQGSCPRKKKTPFPSSPAEKEVEKADDPFVVVGKCTGAACGKDGCVLGNGMPPERYHIILDNGKSEEFVFEGFPRPPKTAKERFIQSRNTKLSTHVLMSEVLAPLRHHNAGISIHVSGMNASIERRSAQDVVVVSEEPFFFSWIGPMLFVQPAPFLAIKDVNFSSSGLRIHSCLQEIKVQSLTVSRTPTMCVSSNKIPDTYPEQPSVHIDAALCSTEAFTLCATSAKVSIEGRVTTNSCVIDVTEKAEVFLFEVVATSINAHAQHESFVLVKNGRGIQARVTASENSSVELPQILAEVSRTIKDTSSLVVSRRPGEFLHEIRRTMYTATGGFVNVK